MEVWVSVCFFCGWVVDGMDEFKEFFFFECCDVIVENLICCLLIYSIGCELCGYDWVVVRGLFEEL